MSEDSVGGVGQEVVYDVAGTGTGVRVTRYDGRGLAEGVMSKRILRYFYGDDKRSDAEDYARQKARDADVGRVALMDDRLSERHLPGDSDE